MFPSFDYNAGDLLWLGDWGPEWIVALAVLGAVILGLSAYDLRPLPRQRRYTLLLLRAAAFLLAVFMLLEPAVDLKNVTKVKSHVPVLVDLSNSMGLPVGRDEATRAQTARELLAALKLPESLEDDNHRYHVLGFGERLDELPLEAALHTAEPSHNASDLSAALAALPTRFAGSEIGGVVVISDGTDTGGMGARVRRGEPLDDASLALLGAIRAPVNALTTGDPSAIRDVAVRRVKHDDFAFVRNRVNVDVEIQSVGYDGVVARVELLRNGEPIGQQDITLRATQDIYNLAFGFVPQQLGREVYTVRVAELADEALTSNNAFHFIQKVIRDKIRVLQVVGRPSWDVRFLRQLLKRNPNIDLISFFILRTNENLISVPNHELSLIPFPTDELFSEQLGSFDLIVFQNFNFGPYSMRQYLPDIANFVKTGGGFVMVGGELSFADGGYANSPIEEILPVKLPSTSQRTVDLAEFRPVLTDAGVRHPITQLAFDAQSNHTLWENLPTQHGTNIVLEAKPWATVLAEHPRLSAGGKPMPVVTVGEIGDGRVMALTTDNSWRWSFERAGDGGTAREYQMFWNNTMRWLIKDPELKLLRVEIEQDIVAPGTKADITIYLQNSDYTPAPDRAGTLIVTRRGLDAKPTAVPPERVAFTTDARGTASLQIDTPEPGIYDVVAEVPHQPAAMTDRDLFLAVKRDPELADVLPRPDLLDAIASKTGGGTSPLTVRLNEPQSVQINRRTVVQLWDSFVVFVLIVGLLLVEWTLRRRYGRL